MTKPLKLLAAALVLIMPFHLSAASFYWKAGNACSRALTIKEAKLFDKLESSFLEVRDREFYNSLRQFRDTLPSYSARNKAYFAFSQQGLNLLALLRPKGDYYGIPGTFRSKENLLKFALEFEPNQANSALRNIFGSERLLLNFSHVMSSSDGFFSELPGETLTLALGWKSNSGAQRNAIIAISRDSGQMYLYTGKVAEGSGTYAAIKDFLAGLKQETRSRWYKWRGEWVGETDITEVKWIDPDAYVLTAPPSTGF